MRWRKKTHGVVTLYTGIPLPRGPIITSTGAAYRFSFHFNDAARIDTMVARLFMISNATECVQTYPLDFLCPGTGHDTIVIYMTTLCSTQMILQYLDNCLTVCTTQCSTRMKIFYSTTIPWIQSWTLYKIQDHSVQVFLSQ